MIARRWSARFCAKGLAVSRGGARIVSDISLDIGPGDAVILTGPNGSGKTTLLRALAGLLRPDAGETSLVAGDDEHGEDGRGGVIYCGPQNAAKAALTVDENLRFWAALYGAPGARIKQARTAFRLDPYADRLAGALSTGLFRRLGLSRLIIAEKPVWLVDEPTASLDAGSIEIFLGHIADHRARGGAAVIATHDALEIDGARRLRLSQSASS
ncbi:MAG: heme ABC exporter ATP-binding protein CcmA [Parvularculaceae bacterium]|nr:heme ABC exporter ATP-binding protein CcmA [Parvularculaceae bacterium]